MRMIFIFIDGFGLGGEDASKNPLKAARTPNLDRIFSEYAVFPADAALGVPGLPQSATGQTAIFTGINAPAALGRHLNAQPTITLKNIINSNNLFKELKSRGFKVTNANTYRQGYLDRMYDPAERKYRPSVTSVMTMSADIPFRKVEHYKNGRGVYHDITGKIIKESGYDVDTITPAEAAQRLYNISRDYDFTLYEHFLTDIVGHSMDMKAAIAEIELLDEFLGSLFGLVDLKQNIIFISSDHGNIEDISVKTHTYNKVPIIVAGNLPVGYKPEIHSLLDIMPAVLEIFGLQQEDRNQG